jgi:D-alanine-D-alanine ligase-like ATP-grasp enzyme
MFPKQAELAGISFADLVARLLELAQEGSGE